MTIVKVTKYQYNGEIYDEIQDALWANKLAIFKEFYNYNYIMDVKPVPPDMVLSWLLNRESIHTWYKRLTNEELEEWKKEHKGSLDKLYKLFSELDAYYLNIK